MVEHIPVLADEALGALALEPDGYYVDATFGRGGHTALLLQALGREGRVLAIDRDPEAIAAGHRRFPAEMRLTLVHASFADIRALVPAHSAGRPCRGVLLDLGVSSPQLDDAARGFSFRADGPIDMRMDPTHGEPVAAWLSRAGVDEMRDVIGWRFLLLARLAPYGLAGEHDVAEKGLLARRIGQDVGRLVLPAVSLVERLNASVVG